MAYLCVDLGIVVVLALLSFGSGWKHWPEHRVLAIDYYDGRGEPVFVQKRRADVYVDILTCWCVMMSLVCCDMIRSWFVQVPLVLGFACTVAAVVLIFLACGIISRVALYCGAEMRWRRIEKLSPRDKQILLWDRQIIQGKMPHSNVEAVRLHTPREYFNIATAALEDYVACAAKGIDGGTLELAGQHFEDYASRLECINRAFGTGYRI